MTLFQAILKDEVLKMVWAMAVIGIIVLNTILYFGVCVYSDTLFKHKKKNFKRGIESKFLCV